jgi:DNA-binding SARP family transcriptional activator
MARLVIEMLGGLRVTTGTGREIRIPSRKARALLACLALRAGAPIAREHLAGLLWDDSDADLARASLRQALVSLRRSLGEDAARASRPGRSSPA